MKYRIYSIQDLYRFLSSMFNARFHKCDISMDPVSYIALEAGFGSHASTSTTAKGGPARSEADKPKEQWLHFLFF